MIFRSKRNTRIPTVPVHEAVFFNIKDHEELVALAEAESDKKYTFGQLALAVRAFASALTRRGIKKGDVVAFYSPNSVEYCVATLGCLSVGAIVTGANYNYTPYELEHQLKDSKAKVLVTISANLQTVKEVQKSIDLQLVITLDKPAASCLYCADLLRDDGSAYPDGLMFDVHQDLAAIMYSSGTTGLPKGVMLTHYNMVANTMSALMAGIVPTSSDGLQAASLGFLPLFHMFGMTLLIGMLLSGITFVTIPAFKPDVFLATIQRYKISMLHLVPPVVLFLAKSPLVDRYDVSSVKGVFSGAAPLTDDLEKEFLARFTNTDYIIQGYGLTEMTAAVTIAIAGKMIPGSSGPLVPNTMAIVVDPSSGKHLGVGEEGEICIKGPQMMKGYLNRPDATRDMIDRQGWLHSGDLGYFDSEGNLFITGRIKELIKHKGFQVAPAEVEGLIMTHPGVDDAAVIGVADTSAGELPRAFVVRKPNSNVTALDISDFVKARLSKHKWLAGGVQFVSSIPKTPSGKIVRREVKKMLTSSKL